MRGDRFVPRLIQFVLAMGVLSAALTVGQDVLTEPDETSAASSGNDAPAGPLPDAKNIVPPQNSSTPENDTETRDFALPCPACDGLLA